VIVSLVHGFIFVRGRKVAGTSVEIALSTICGPEDVVPPMIPVDERIRQEAGGRSGNYSDNPAMEQAYVRLVMESPVDRLHRLRPPPSHYTAHMSLTEIVSRYPGSLQGFRVVAVQRSPYARVLSALNMAQSFDVYRRGGTMQGDPATLAPLFDRALRKGAIHALKNLDLYRGADGVLAAAILRYENLQADLDSFLHQIGHDAPVELPHAKKGVLSNGIDPTRVFRRDQIDSINAIFADEFETFGYFWL